jgi:hypothetical protein
MPVIHQRCLYHSIRISVLGLWEKLGWNSIFVRSEGGRAHKILRRNEGGVIWRLMRIFACEGWACEYDPVRVVGDLAPITANV